MLRAPAPQQPATRHLDHLKRRHDLLQAILVCVDVAGQTAAEALQVVAYELHEGLHVLRLLGDELGERAQRATVALQQRRRDSLSAQIGRHALLYLLRHVGRASIYLRDDVPHHDRYRRQLDLANKGAGVVV